MTRQKVASSITKNNWISNSICDIIKSTKLDDNNDILMLESKLRMILDNHKHWIKDLDIYFTDNNSDIIVEWTDRKNKKQCISYPLVIGATNENN